MSGITGMTARPNVLVTSASRKVLLVRAFREALGRLGGGRVVAADVSPLSAALFEADEGRLVPRSDDPAFLGAIERLCEEQAVGLIVPTRDEELPVFAAAHDRFRALGIVVLVSPLEAVAACQDKRRFSDAVMAAGLDAPRTYDEVDAPLPAFVKPRVGKGGRGATVVRTRAELLAALAAIDGEAIVQELVEAPEHTVDVFLDLDCRPITCVPRERVAVVAGESVVSRTVRDPELVEQSLRLCEAIGLRGHVTVQAFRSADRIAFIEINPRYGGAANLSFAAGAHTPELAIRMARGERLEPSLGAYDAGLVMLRHADDRIVRDADLSFAVARP
ncbi:MAG TPA: ATP-grasp domain-containing protein [Candidatus Limnocylindrales bacterium]|nr:ATP-grasp domain-containing protein [Candidatus Limnocylindrales bacterium]